MHTFRIWAPAADAVAVSVNGMSHELQRSRGGWWSITIEDAYPGTNYQFCVNGGLPLPDPRSQWQPDGIHGPSRLVDHSAFSWTDQKWQARPLSSAVIYEAHIGTFTPAGTFQGAIERLDYLVDLGITHLELMPVNEFSGDWGWGYDGADLFAPHHAYGTPDDLKAMVNACHQRGLAVLLDVVYNHLGPVGNYLAAFGPYFTDVYKTPWGQAVNLDQAGSHEVRRFFADNALMWLRDYHFDGLRLDAVHAFRDQSALHFLEFLSSEVSTLASQIGKHLSLVAESDLNDPRLVRRRDAGGLGMDAQWSDDFHHALHTVLTGERNGYYEDFAGLEHLARALQRAYIYDGTYSPHRDRLHGHPATGLSGHRFLGYAQNHDQIGNRARGERLAHLLSVGRQKIAAALVITSPFIPMLFQGEEFAASTPFQYFTHHEDPDLGRKVSEGRRNEFRAFGWKPDDIPDPQNPETFARSKLRWEEIQEEPHASMLAWYRDLIALRRENSDFTDGRLDQVNVAFDETARWISIRRGRFEVICNLAEDTQAIAARGHDLVLASEEDVRFRPDLIEIPPDSVAILRD